MKRERERAKVVKMFYRAHLNLSRRKRRESAQCPTVRQMGTRKFHDINIKIITIGPVRKRERERTHKVGTFRVRSAFRESSTAFWKKERERIPKTERELD